MTTPITDPATTAALIKVTGEQGLTKTGYEKTFSKDGSSTLTENLAGPTVLIEEYYADKKANGINVTGGSLSVVSGKGSVGINYSCDSGSEPQGGEVEGTAPEWNFEPMENMRSLASHPYWLEYVPEAGYTIDQYLVMIDLQISKGQAYSDPSGGYYDAWLKRYYALKACGVEEYPTYGLQLTKSYVTSDVDQVITAFTGIGQCHSITEINPPEMYMAAMGALQQIKDYGLTNPDNPANVRYDAGKWEWLKRPTLMSPGGNEKSNIVRITEMWWGVDRWSKVFYKGGTWDPPITA